MTAGELKDLFRTEMKDAVAPFLWSDAEIFAFADDAQTMFCRMTDGIADATTAAVCQVALAQGATFVTLHSRIKKIRTATLRSNKRPVEIINMEDMATRCLVFDTPPDILRTLVLGLEENKARALRPISAADTLDLVVFRLPLVTLDDAADALEIPVQHHPHLLLWMKHRALMKHDAETFDAVKAADMEAAFVAYCARARREQGDTRHKIRTVAYGGL